MKITCFLIKRIITNLDTDKAMYNTSLSFQLNTLEIKKYGFWFLHGFSADQMLQLISIEDNDIIMSIL